MFNAAVVLAYLSIGLNSYADGEAPFTVADDIAMTTIQSPEYSPDGRYFFVITERGDIERNVPEYDILVWSSQEVAQYIKSPIDAAPPQPLVLARIDSYKDGPMNGLKVQWLDDSSGVTYTALNAGGLFQLYKADLTSKTVQAMTPDWQNVTGYSIEGRNLVYTTTSSEVFSALKSEAAQSVGSVTGQELSRRLFPMEATDRTVLQYFPYSDVWAVIDGRRFQVENAASHTPVHVYSLASASSVRAPFALSPNGRFLAISQPVQVAPADWANYASPPGAPYRISRDHYRLGVPQQMHPLDDTMNAIVSVSSYQLLELSTGTFTQLIDAPTALYSDWNSEFNTPRWAPDGGALLITSFLPLRGPEGEGRDIDRKRPCLAVVNLDSRSTNCVLALAAGLDKKRFGIRNADFDQKNLEHIEVEFDALRYVPSGEAFAIYQANGNGRLPIDSGDARFYDREIRVSIHQGLNDPPVLVATDNATSKHKVLWDPNPQLHDKALGEVRVIHWKDRTGWEYMGDMFLPPGYEPNKRYPLVIQTHGATLNRFMTAGATTTAFAARELASAGIVVVQMGWNSDHFGDPTEEYAQVEGFASLVKMLDRQGVVDRSKVGLAGWSRSVFHTYGALVADRPKLAAAMVIEGVNFGYWQYLAEVSQESGIADEAHTVIGRAPFGAGLNLWVKRSPIFHLDHVIAPLLMLETGRQTLLEDWEPYAALYALHKAVDMVSVPEGPHVETNPGQRLATQGTNVDWFRFWLQGHEYPDPKKAEQYHRWERLCDLQSSQHPERPAYCVGTKH